MLAEPRSSRRRGFTLVEVMVAATLTILVLTGVVAFYVAATKERAYSGARAGLARDAAFLSQVLTTELRMAGLGVPSSGHASAIAGLAGDRVRPMLYGSATEVGVVADMPRADAQYNTFGYLDPYIRRRGNFMFHNENNGSCARSSQANFDCSIADTSTFFREQGCGGGGVGDRVCPWGMKRLSAGEYVLIAAGNGTWSQIQMPSPIATGASSGQNVFTVQYNYNGSHMEGNAWAAQNEWPNRLAGMPWATTLDRVMFRYDAAAKTVLRQQCWGVTAPDHASWPPFVGTPARPLTPGAVNAATGVAPFTTCTTEEVIARNVTAFQFDYFNVTNGTLTAPLDTTELTALRRIDFRATFSTTAAQRTVTHEVTGSAAIRN